MSLEAPTTSIWEGSGVTNMARVEGWDGSNIVQADISSAQYWVRNVTDGTDVVGTSGSSGASLTVANIIYDTLQTDDRWDEDDTGYNFRHHVSGDNLSGANKKYRIEYELTPSASEFSSSPIYVVFEVVTADRKGT